MKKILAALFVTLFLCTSAQALLINFDQSGSGDPNNLSQFDRWQMTSFATQNPDAGDLLFRDIYTYQSTITGAFTEVFTMEVDKGYNSLLGPAGTVAFDNIFANVSLAGTYYNDNNIQFTSGTVSLLKGAVSIAELTLQSSLISQLTGTLLAAGDLGMKIDLAFVFNWVDSNYFGADEVDLVGKKWLMSVVGGRIDQDGLWPVGQDEILIGWDVSGFIAEFAAVPEPATMLLFGLGLIGLAGASRRKLS
jgi:hypothetical protein